MHGRINGKFPLASSSTCHCIHISINVAFEFEYSFGYSVLVILFEQILGPPFLFQHIFSPFVRTFYWVILLSERNHLL
jgi:hypothetical protein